MNLVRVALVCNLDGRWLQLDFDNGYKTMINVDLKAKELFALRPAQPQETEERSENSPASPVQQAKDAIKPADYEYCPHCHGSFSFAKLGSDFKCKWCKKDVRTSGRLA